MLVEVTLANLATASTLAGGGFAGVNYLVYLWASSRFVTRREWHYENGETGKILGTLQTKVTTMSGELEAGGRRMDEMHRDAKDTKDLVQRVSESASRVEGMLMVMGAPSANRRKEDRQWTLDL